MTSSDEVHWTEHYQTLINVLNLHSWMEITGWKLLHRILALCVKLRWLWDTQGCCVGPLFASPFKFIFKCYFLITSYFYEFFPFLDH